MRFFLTPDFNSGEDRCLFACPRVLFYGHYSRHVSDLWGNFRTLSAPKPAMCVCVRVLARPIDLLLRGYGNLRRERQI